MNPEQPTAPKSSPAGGLSLERYIPAVTAALVVLGAGAPASLGSAERSAAGPAVAAEVGYATGANFPAATETTIAAGAREVVRRLRSPVRNAAPAPADTKDFHDTMKLLHGSAKIAKTEASTAPDSCAADATKQNGDIHAPINEGTTIPDNGLSGTGTAPDSSIFVNSGKGASEGATRNDDANENAPESTDPADDSDTEVVVGEDGETDPAEPADETTGADEIDDEEGEAGDDSGNGLDEQVTDASNDTALVASNGYETAPAAANDSNDADAEAVAPETECDVEIGDATTVADGSESESDDQTDAELAADEPLVKPPFKGE